MAVSVQTTPAHRRVRTVAGMVAVLGVGAYVLVVALSRRDAHINTGDTDNLVQGVHTAWQCLRDGILTSCKTVASGPRSLVYPYPLLQYLPASAFVGVGLGDTDVLKALALLSLVCFVIAVGSMWRGFTLRWPRVIGVLALFGSALTYQANAAFGEMLAACVTLGAIVATAKRRPWLAATLCCFAATSKETMFPFVVALGLAVVLTSRDGAPRRRMVFAVVGGSGVGLGLDAAFNVFRFGSLFNVGYSAPEYKVHGLGRIAAYFTGQVVSPSAGLVWFWTLAVVVLTAGLAFGAMRWAREGWRDALTSLAAPATMVVYLGGLALWFSPFGWIAYGHRLAVPLLPAVVFVALRADEERLQGLFERAPRWVLGVFGVAVLAVSWPQFAAPQRWYPAVLRLIAADANCPRMTDWGTAGARCMYNTMFRLRPFVLRAAAGGGDGRAWIARFAGTVLVVGLVTWAAAGPRRSGAGSERADGDPDRPEQFAERSGG